MVHVLHVLVLGGLAAQEGYGAARRWCGESFVSFDAMEAIQGGRADFAARLAELGFVDSDYVQRVRFRLDVDYDVAADANANDARLVSAALAAGIYPQVVRAENPVMKFTKVAGGAFESEQSAGAPKFFERKKGRVFIHPSSVLAGVKKVRTRPAARPAGRRAVRDCQALVRFICRALCSPWLLRAGPTSHV